ncbi:molybdenum cofactor biosynthesis protein MoaE [Pseudoroseicyclus aestuarii]|uniref:Molybdopterin synthase catalytic subunit n=1 Tax=Pseudoroseicyclus aestuarii TaxID=1795041 RepID=A0A318T239_9RHOB|nr:molybdenum cofactor biosynthesis protein MoaE [Pseudoroseicyclus aestuarii]PYE84274.1 molybdopterin synthase subunit MoaE [Pseudoroseicyclus aestuarii]
MTVRVQQEAFAAGAELDAFTARATGAGAIVSFTGVVRDVAGGLIAMEIEQYPGMTERAIAEIVDAARSRWDLAEVLVIHRHGPLAPGAPIMMVATASAHRAAAFEAADYLMDYLKSRAPFWKKEITQRGEHWVEATTQDEDALSRW